MLSYDKMTTLSVDSQDQLDGMVIFITTRSHGFSQTILSNFKKDCGFSKRPQKRIETVKV